MMCNALCTCRFALVRLACLTWLCWSFCTCYTYASQCHRSVITCKATLHSCSTRAATHNTMSTSNGQDKEEGQNGVPLKIGFQKTKAPRQRVEGLAARDRDDDRRQLISGFHGAQAQTVGVQDNGEDGCRRVYVVPKLENTFQTGKKRFAPSFVPPAHDAPTAGSGDRFEAAAQDTRPTITTYGLEVRTRHTAADQQGPEQQQEGQAEQQQRQYVHPSQLEQQAFKEDMEVLPNAPSEEAYETMPIEEFGRAMLMGMGWRDGEGVGKNRKDAKPIEYLRRPERLGLGAQPAALETADKKKIVKMGDKPDVRREDLVLAPTADGRTRNIRTLDEKLVHRSEVAPGPRAGKTMRVEGGRHAGLNCVVLTLLPVEEGRSGRASVRLLPSQEVVEVRLKDLQDISQAQGSPSPAPDRAAGRREADRQEHRGSRERGHDGTDSHRGDRPERGQREESDRGNGHRAENGSHRDRGEARQAEEGRLLKRVRGTDGLEQHGKHSKRHHHHTDSEDEHHEPRAPSWLAPNIKVRVIDKHARDGRLYLKKGTVVDVHPGGLCDVVIDETRQSVQLKQRQLETVIPKDAGTAVLIVSGPLKGNKARLHAKSDKGACAVQLVSDYTIQRLLLDEVAMYVGSLDDD